MIATAVIDEIQKMLRQSGLSQRKIAVRLGVSRGTVNAIAQGKRAPRHHARGNRGDGFIPPSGLPTRCPECGALVQMPCLLCYLRKRSRQSRVCTSAESTRAPNSTDRLG